MAGQSATVAARNRTSGGAAEGMRLDRSPVGSRGDRLVAASELEEPGLPPEEKRKLEGRNRKLLRDHGRAWLGSRLAAYLLDRDGYRFVLERGWLVEVQAPELDAGFIAALARAPEARMLRRLVIDGAGGASTAALEPLRSATFADRLKELQIGSGAAEEPVALLDRLLLGA